MIPATLAEAGLPTSLATAADDERWDVALRSSTSEALELVGVDVGTPILLVDGTAVFGPVLTACPCGSEAVALFDANEQSSHTGPERTPTTA